MTELWIEIIGYEGHYEVSDKGRVRSIKSRGLILKQGFTNGYQCVWLRRENKRKVKFWVHRLVALAHLPPPPGDPRDFFVNHKDRVRINNISINLEWVTPRENTAHWQQDDKKKEEEVTSDMPF